jgi:hypothetical protein
MSDLIDALASLNWIDRLDELLGDIQHGEHHKFFVPRDCGWSGWEMEQLLRRHGVTIWGRGFAPDCLYFSVKRRQANWAEYLLRRRGIPVVSRLVNPKNDEYAERHAPGSEPPMWQWHSKGEAKGRANASKKQPGKGGNDSCLLNRLLSFLDSLR